MTTAYTPILKLALPVTGELNGTWGTVVNDNITSMVEQAVAGLATINTWTTNSHTLTSADGTTSESRCAMLVIDDDGAGNPSAAATVICPTATKSYIVRNICGQTVTVKTSAGTGVAVPNNQAALVFCDGTNVVTGAFNGDVVGPATATNNAIVTFDGTTGKIIKDNSGATISAGVITATGFSGPLNGTVGATTPATGAFTTASATTGNITTVNATTVNATTVDTTNIEVTNLKAKDGTAAGSIADITGVVTITTLAATTGNITTVNATNVNATTVDTTNIEVTNLKAKDGTAAGSIADSTGVVTLTTLASTTGNITTVNATTVDTTNLEVTNLKAKDGTSAGSIADATGVVTLASSVLTTTDINGGTIDATSIGATTAAAGSFTNLSVSGTTSFDGSEGTNGQVLTSAGTGNTPTWTTPTVGTVTSVTGTAPVVSSGGATPAISMAAATASVNGYLTSTDWNTFNNKGSGSGSVTSVAASVPAFLSVAGSPVTTSGTLAISYSGTALPVANGGTGLTSVTSARVPYGNGSSALNTSANLTFNGETLTVNSIAVSARTTESNSGANNTAVGNSALSTSVSGVDTYSSCTAVGYSALRNNENSVNTAVGAYSLYSNTTGGSNTAVGNNALMGNDVGSSNIAIGYNALQDSISANYNTAIGVSALSNTLTSGSNTAVGYRSMLNVKSEQNTAIGYGSLGNVIADITGGTNIGIGLNTGGSLTSGAGNIIIHSGGSAVFNVTTQNDRIVMGTTAVTNAYVQVAWTVVSDARDKMNFGSVPHGLNFVNQLNPISYQFKNERDAEVPVPHGNVRYGFKAQDILALEGNKPIIIDAEDPEKLRYNGEALVPVLVNAIKELSAQLEEVKAQLAALKA